MREWHDTVLTLFLVAAVMAAIGLLSCMCIPVSAVCQLTAGKPLLVSYFSYPSGRRYYITVMYNGLHDKRRGILSPGALSIAGVAIYGVEVIDDTEGEASLAWAFWVTMVGAILLTVNGLGMAVLAIKLGFTFRPQLPCLKLVRSGCRLKEDEDEWPGCDSSL